MNKYSTNLLLLERLNFLNKRVLVFGIKNQDIIDYINKKGAEFFEGVFLQDIDHERNNGNFIQSCNNNQVFHDIDALKYFKTSIFPGKKEINKTFDIILFLDFIEYIPRKKLKEILNLLPDLMHHNSILAINSCFFERDNNGDSSIPYANTYSVVSLRKFLDECGFQAISEAQIYRKKLVEQEKIFSFQSFYQNWKDALAEGFPLDESYSDDELTYASSCLKKPNWHSFTDGRMKNMSLYLKDDYVQYFKDGSYDEEILSSIEKRFHEDITIFDVGGFMGVSSLLFSSISTPDSKILCFEPNPFNLIRILKNWSQNIPLSQNLKLYPIAFGDKHGKEKMLISDSIDDGHSSTSRFISGHCTITEEELFNLGFLIELIETTTLDTFVIETGIIPDVIKVDIEGAEHLFLFGAINTLTKHEPTLYIEFHSPFCTLKSTEFLALLGYRIDVLHEEEDRRLIVCCSKTQIQIDEDEISDYLAKVKTEELLLKMQKFEREKNNFEKELYETRDKLFELQRQLDDTKNQLDDTKNQLDDTKNQLDDTKNQLDDTKNQLDDTQSLLFKLQNNFMIRIHNRIQGRLYKKIIH